MSLSDFTSPWWLLFLLVVIGLVVGYVLVQRARHRHTLRFSNMDLLEKVAPTRPGYWRHVPTALVLVGLLLLTVALAGPTSDQKVPRNRATVMLVIDVSLSMEATDVEPSRLAAAQEAGKSFADGLTPGINLGLVAFAGTASVLVSPTANREATKTAIDKLQLSERTATGEAIFTSLQSIDTLGAVLGGGDAAPPARIVLLSDGKQTVPESPDDPRGGYTAARAAKDKNVPISTISFGTSYGTVDIEDDSGVERVPVPVDDPSLREIANLSGGSFFTASSLEELRAVYDTLEEQIGFEITRGDASRPWLILGVLFTATGLGTALVLRQRLP
ncbi:VWA domain-containing protein [Rhodococcus sp. BP-252]|uniref:VWA domain-containing protein n=1 Tax=unclassified Rhodococcus (in: high G+C Gram-positive bacteria) TaxID=192944 RepID=UPI001C9A32E1|nr:MULTISPECIES: VWA domain-containing protein [unclassified Rhodococcus (in: high G+C Gram-positive bacteria)]MBY6410016.1 VWA domain-containing protein [Rhodococcus sp. BP-320]MBY6414985.1 VWA domain-containing protein [Rhodococcus sp. BP-321]MBY6421312.1 VWA domain-containing protein [Rhodococcus sp. BP-324]MBY6425707.1 VWA domain-containing protein [Rhodococcus sp. BP-323]MBY6429881.1 VWA domain-containing protein [Rhodococcus sp. BP-322]